MTCSLVNDNVIVIIYINFCTGSIFNVIYIHSGGQFLKISILIDFTFYRKPPWAFGTFKITFNCIRLLLKLMHPQTLFLGWYFF